MKALRPYSFHVLVVLILLLASACTLTPNIKYTATLVPEPATAVPAISTNTLAPPPPPTAVPTPAIIANGQIAYISEGNVWRHIFSNSMAIQVTTDGMSGDPGTAYKNPRLSPDGRYLAYTKAGVSALADLVDGTFIDLSSYGEFISWTGQGHEFFAQIGNMECPAVENLADQALLNFDLYRYDLANLSSPIFLANISGGLKFVSAISKDGQWASINSCGCYSECGNEQLWHLPTASVITPPPDLYPGNFDFSPNSSALTVSTWQMYGYTESPLYVGNIDMSGLTSIFSDPQTAPQLALWSPDEQWLAFTAITFDTDGMEITERRVMLVKADGTNLGTVEGGMASLVDWSPDGSKLLYRQTAPASETYATYELSSGLKQHAPIYIDAYSSGNMDWGNLQ
jgi:Tol biopolymer transport system component